MKPDPMLLVWAAVTGVFAVVLMVVIGLIP
jgi:hypothetical protein